MAYEAAWLQLSHVEDATFSFGEVVGIKGELGFILCCIFRHLACQVRMRDPCFLHGSKDRERSTQEQKRHQLHYQRY